MNLIKKLSVASSLLVVTALPAMAGVNVSNPANGSQVAPSFTLTADASTCSSQDVVAMGYSMDSGSDQKISFGTTLQGVMSAGAGSHTVHVKAWGWQGAVCVADVLVNVTTSNSIIPGNAVSVSNIQNLGYWKALHDPATGGAAGGVMDVVASPSRSGNTRKFVSSYTNYGGMLYTTSFDDDQYSQNFFYDAWVYIEGNSDNIASIEMDLNQTMPNGQTVIYGVQCDGWSGTWDYTANTGSPDNPHDQWIHSYAACNPRSWARNTWHHVQISYSRDGSGNVCYKSVWFDEAEQDIYITVPSAFALGWAPRILTNFQIDGLIGSGWTSSTVYLDDLTIYRW
jgi:hypothetical protein